MPVASEASRPSAHWLTLDRVRAYPRIALAVFIVAAATWVWLAADLVDAKGKPLGYDFITFWAASHLALAGEPAAAFDMARIFAAERIAVPALSTVFLWHYPPTFHLVVLPLALLPYIPAYLAWTGATLAGFAWTVRRLAPSAETAWLALAFPATFVNAFHGQNGFLTASLLGGAVLLLERRPAAAGVLIGLLSVKPQLGLLIPLALLCGRHWTVFAAAAATTLAVAALSALVIGLDSWAAFWANIPLVGVLLDKANLPWAKIPSVYVALRMLGSPAAPAYALHAVVALAVAATVAWVWARRPPPPLAGAVLVSGAVLVPPYLFDYDLVVLAVPLAILGWDGVRRGWLAYEREALVFAWLLPVLAPTLAEATGVPLAPLGLAALFAVAVRRALTLEGALRQN